MLGAGKKDRGLKLFEAWLRWKVLEPLLHKCSRIFQQVCCKMHAKKFEGHPKTPPFPARHAKRKLSGGGEIIEGVRDIRIARPKS